MIAGVIRRYVRNDLRRNRGTAIALVLVIVLSAFLMASGAVVLERLSGAVDRMFALAKPPHFLQMHRGDIDRTALEAFAAEHGEIDDWLIEEMVGFPSDGISWERQDGSERGDLSASMIDHLFVAQNDGFDLLLDERDAAADPDPGTALVPVAVAQEYGLGAGDRLAVETASGPREFEIVGTVRDAQMASSMSSATRILIAQEDLDDLLAAGGGDPESIVEYRLAEGADLGAFQRDYEADPALPHNGQAVTEVMIRLVNMFSDGLVAIGLVFASALLIGIAMLNIRFVIRGTIEDDVREIGAMKAIGIPDRTIESLFLARYGVMAVVGCALGGGLAALAAIPLTRSIETNFASPPVTWLTIVAPVLALLLVLATVLLICALSLRRIRRLGVIDTLVHGRTDAPRAARRRARGRPRAAGADAAAGDRPASRLGGATGRALTLRLALSDLRAQRRRWILLPAVMCLGALLVTLPATLLATFESPRFMTYLGAPQSDLRSDIQFASEDSAAASELADSLIASMEADPRIDAVEPYAALRAEASGPEGWEPVRVEIGDYSGSDLEFQSGRAPAEGEIALSVLNAERLGVSIGDAVELRGLGAPVGEADPDPDPGPSSAGAEPGDPAADPAADPADPAADPVAVADVESPRLSGIYQDVTAGGFTAKLQGEVPAVSDRWTVYAQLAPGEDPSAVAADLEEEFPAAKTLEMEEYTAQTLEYATNALRTSALISTVFAVLAIGLISVLFLRLAFSRDKRELGTLTAIGFSAGELAGITWLKTLLASALGIVLGVVLAATAGSALVSGAIGLTGTGITRLDLLPNPWISYLALPLLLLAASALGALVYDRRLRAADRSNWLR